MSSKTLAVAIVALTLSLLAVPAAAAAKKKDDSSRTIVRTEIIDGVPRRVVTRITVKRRSYLDGGTEVMPADNINSFRSTFMSYRPGSAATQNTAFDRPSWVNDPFFLAGKRNPYPWIGN